MWKPNAQLPSDAGIADNDFSLLLQNYFGIAESMEELDRVCVFYTDMRTPVQNAPPRRWPECEMVIYRHYREKSALWGPLREWSIDYWVYQTRMSIFPTSLLKAR